MKSRITALLMLLVALSTAQAYAQDIKSSEPSDGFVGTQDGRKAADAMPTGGWLSGGLGSGLFFGFIGTGVIYAIAGSSEAEVPQEYFAGLQAKGAAYMSGFNQAFVQRIKARRKKAALIGGLTGTAISTTIIVLAVVNSGDDYDYYYSRVPVLQVSIPTR